MDDLLTTGNILTLVTIAGVVLPLLKKHWYRFTQILWLVAMVMTDAKIVRWMITSDSGFKTKLVLGGLGVLAFTLAFVWAIWRVQRDMAEAASEAKALVPLLAKLTDYERAVLRQVVLVGRSTGVLNAAALSDIEANTGFVTRTWVGHYELNKDLKESLRTLLATDERSLLVSLEPGIPLLINAKSEGRQPRQFRANELAGEEPRALEGFSISFDPKIDGLSLEYMGHFEVAGDVPYVSEGELLTAGDNSQLEGFAIRLTGANKIAMTFYTARMLLSSVITTSAVTIDFADRGTAAAQ